MSEQDNGADTSVAKALAAEEPGPQTGPPTPASSAPPENDTSGRPNRILRIHRAVKEIEPWGILLAVVPLLLSLITSWSDYSDRVEERTVRAWQLLTTQAPGNSGKIAALQYLNNEDGLLCAGFLRGHLEWLHSNDRVSCLISLKAPTPLPGIDVSPPNPEDNGTPEDPADDPPGAYLLGVDLHDADLHYANLTDANLFGANLTGLMVTGLTQEQLSGGACGDKETKLPAGLTIPPCAQEPAP